MALMRRHLALLSLATAVTAAGFAPSGVAAASAAPFVEWHGYQYDNAHSGLSPAVPAVGRLSSAWKAQLDGPVQASPLVVAGIVIAATENNTMYGLERMTGRTLWSRHLGTPVRRSALPCGNIDPLGITGTPVADASNSHVFAVTTTPNGSSIQHRLVSLNPHNGALLSSTVVDPPNQDPVVENQRGALAIAKGRVVIPFGGHAGDCGNYHGYLVSTSISGTAIGSYRLGFEPGVGLWQPSGPSTDTAGNVYAVSGNGFRYSGAWDGSNAVLKYDPVTLRLLSAFAPSNWPDGNRTDTDLGSSGAALVGGKVWVQGKSSSGYVLDQANLGGVGGQRSTLTGACQSQFGGAAVHQNAIYAPCTDGLRKLALLANGTVQAGWRAPAEVTGTPVLGGGAVWALAPRSGSLYALSESTGQVLETIAVGSLARFATPALSGTLALIPTTTGITAVNGA